MPKYAVGSSQHRILIVDENCGIQSRWIRALGSAGYEIYQSIDRADALRTMYAIKPHLILLASQADLDETLEALEHIRLFTNVPILLFVERDAAQLSTLGENKISGVLDKSAAVTQILREVDRILKRSASDQGERDVPLKEWDKNLGTEFNAYPPLKQNCIRKIRDALRTVNDGEVWLVKTNGVLDRILVLKDGAVKTYDVSG